MGLIKITGGGVIEKVGGLLNGQTVNQVSKNVGTSMEMIQQTYDGLSARYSMDKLGFFKDTNVPKEEDI